MVLRAETVARPSPHAGITGQLIPRVHVGDRGVVVDRLGVQAFYDADVVRNRLNIGQQIADPGAMFAAALAGHQWRHDRERALVARHAGDALRAFDRGGQVKPGVPVQHGFIVEEIDVREAAALEQAEHALRLGREMRQTRQPLSHRAGRTGRTQREGEVGRKQGAERDAADPAGITTDKGATGEMTEVIVSRLHGQLRVMVSLKLKSSDATWVQAACSAGRRRWFRGDSPTASNASAAGVSLA